MTEPTDESTAGSSVSAAGSGPETSVPEPGAPGPAPAPAPTGWIAPDSGGRGGRSRGCCLIVAIVGGVVAVLAVVSILGLIFLGGQVLKAFAGTVQFGTGAGTGCSVTGTATSFPTSASIHSVAFLERKANAGEVITIVVTFPGVAPETTTDTMDSVADCITQEIDPGLAAGHYELEYRAGTELLAKGGFDIVP